MLLIALTMVAFGNSKVHTSELLIPVVPSPYGATEKDGSSVPLPKGAKVGAPWVSDWAPVHCENHGGFLTAMFSSPVADWPYSLPKTVTCSQGGIQVIFQLGFRSPVPSQWTADDGTLVVPRGLRGGVGVSFVAPADVSAAAVVPAVPGVSCSLSPSGGSLFVDVDSDATASTAVCRLSMKDGTTVERGIAVPTYE